MDDDGALESYTKAAERTFSVQGIIIGFDNEADLKSVVHILQSRLPSRMAPHIKPSLDASKGDSWKILI